MTPAPVQYTPESTADSNMDAAVLLSPRRNNGSIELRRTRDSQDKDIDDRPLNEEEFSTEDEYEKEHVRPARRVGTGSKDYTDEEEKAVIHKFDRRLVLFMALLYMLSFLDRSSETAPSESVQVPTAGIRTSRDRR